MWDPISKALEEAEKLVTALQGLKASSTSTDHLTLLKHTDKICLKLEEPYDIVTRWLENMAVASALYTLIQIGAFQNLPSNGSVSAQKLATDVNVDPSVIMRTMRVVVINGIAIETASDDYRLHTSQGKEGLTYYEVLNEDEAQRTIWNNTRMQMEKNMPIVGMFSLFTLKDQFEENPDLPFIVDTGSECPKFFGGKVVLQDLPIVIDSLKAEDIPGITPTIYDIFTPQPVKNAHAYLMRRLLHDFYIPVCIDILKNIVPSMNPRSRLIICEMLVPERVEVGGPMKLYWLDFSLMTISGREQTLMEFISIFDEVGHELVKVYPSGIVKTAMMETRLRKNIEL